MTFLDAYFVGIPVFILAGMPPSKEVWRIMIQSGIDADPEAAAAQKKHGIDFTSKGSMVVLVGLAAAVWPFAMPFALHKLLKVLLGWEQEDWRWW